MSTPETTKTTKDKVKDMFLSGKILTSCGAAKDFLTADLRRIITTLKKEGMDIVDRWATSITSKRYKEYFLREFTPKPITTTEPIVPPAPIATNIEPIPEIKSVPGPEPTRIQQSFVQQKLFTA